jgi:hypothetical protein
MPFDSSWFNELRALSDVEIRDTRARGIAAYVPNVGEICGAGHLSASFENETASFVRSMAGTPYALDQLFRGYPRHVVNFPRGRAFRRQWNIGLTAGDQADDDYVRIGIGFRLSNTDQRGIDEYLDFRREVGRRPAVFDAVFHGLGNFYQFLGFQPPGQSVSACAAGNLSTVVIADRPPLDGWRFFGRCLWFRDPQDQAVIGSHQRLRDAFVDVCDRIQRAGFGY